MREKYDGEEKKDRESQKVTLHPRQLISLALQGREKKITEDFYTISVTTVCFLVVSQFNLLTILTYDYISDTGTLCSAPFESSSPMSHHLSINPTLSIPNLTLFTIQATTSFHCGHVPNHASYLRQRAHQHHHQSTLNMSKTMCPIHYIGHRNIISPLWTCPKPQALFTTKTT